MAILIQLLGFGSKGLAAGYDTPARPPETPLG